MRAVKHDVIINVPDRFKYLLGCEKCEFGRIHIVPLSEGWRLYPLARTIPELLLAMFRDGLYTHCDCDAGQAAARALEYSATKLEADEVAMREVVAQAAQYRLERVFTDAHVPQRFADLTWEGFKALAGRDPGKREAIQVIDSYLDIGHLETTRGMRFGIMLYGKSGVGKTGALCPLFLHYIRQGLPGLWIQYNDLLAALKDFGSGQVEERIKAAKYAQFLFIDDFGDPAAERQATDYARDVIFRIIDHRNNYQAPTFITSNLDPNRLSGQFHERIVKRLAELCHMVEVGGSPMHELIDEHNASTRWNEPTNGKRAAA